MPGRRSPCWRARRPRAPWTVLGRNAGGDALSMPARFELEFFGSDTAHVSRQPPLGAAEPLGVAPARPTRRPASRCSCVTADPAEGEALTEPGTDIIETGADAARDRARASPPSSRRITSSAPSSSASATAPIRRRWRCGRPARIARSTRMSDGTTIFLARWSRRKQAARQRIEAEARRGGRLPRRPQPERRPAGPGAGRAPNLPRAACRSLEDLTADSDLSAFLREGVPEALRNAALRKMWSLDPAIRDYVGPRNMPGTSTSRARWPASARWRRAASVADFLSTVSRRARPHDPPSGGGPGSAGARARAGRRSLPPEKPAQAPDTPDEPSAAGRRGMPPKRPADLADTSRDAVPATPWRRLAAVGRPLSPVGFPGRRTRLQ